MTVTLLLILYTDFEKAKSTFISDSTLFEFTIHAEAHH